MYFSTSCKNIEVVYRDDVYDIQELLKSAALLITDYSSVHFDFAYMKKPVIYYQFDQKEFFQKQYQKSFFDAEKNGFGPVVYDTDGVVRALTDAYREGFQMEQKYYDRMRSFYQIYDAKNCERVYQTICEWLVMKNAHK
jgi:CDP-glycerol glycerophosphotransferase (TagB/SpsB family)